MLKTAIPILSLLMISACGGSSNSDSPLSQVSKSLPASDFATMLTEGEVLAQSVGDLYEQSANIPNDTVEYQGFMAFFAGSADASAAGNMSMVVDFVDMKYGAYIYNIVDENEESFGDFELTLSGNVASDGSLDGTLSGTTTTDSVLGEIQVVFDGVVDSTVSKVVGTSAEGVFVGGEATSTATLLNPPAGAEVNETVDQLTFGGFGEAQ